MTQQPMIISIEANIGAGKTTVLQHIRGMLDNINKSVIILEEPVDEWTTTIPSVFTEYYKDTTKYAFSIQTMIYSSIRKRIENIFHQSTPPSILLTERSLGSCSNVFTKMLYESRHLNDIEYQIYNAYVANDPDAGWRRGRKTENAIYGCIGEDTSLYNYGMRSMDADGSKVGGLRTNTFIRWKFLECVFKFWVLHWI